MLQTRLSTADPGHFFPPSAGVGLLHSRVRVWDPPLHFAEHSPHLPHELHCPSTIMMLIEKCEIKNAILTLES